ncbi:MAG: glycosyltransferase 87 family protein [Edaphobacter sp.]
MRKIWRKNDLGSMALVPLSIAALVSLGVGIRHAIQYRCHDLQWLGARLVGQRIDPWREYLEHFPHHIGYVSPPNYLHLLYLILLPLGLLNFETAALLWTGGTVCLSVVCVLLLRRLFNLDRFQTVLVLCLLWMSSPFRVVLEVGQMSFFELFFLTVAYLAASTALSGLSFGVSLVKYSFSPAAGLLFLFRGRFRFLLYAAAVPLIGLFVVWLFVRTPLLRLALEPLAVSASPTAVSPGFADLMTLVEHTIKTYTTFARPRQIAYMVGLFGSAAYALLLSRFRLSRSAEFTLISIASLFFVTHLVYDYVFLAVPLCFALTQKSMKIKGLLISFILTFWFILPLFERKWQNDPNIHLGQLAVNCGLLAIFLAFITSLVTTAAGHASESPRAQHGSLHEDMKPALKQFDSSICLFFWGASGQLWRNYKRSNTSSRLA